MGQVYTFGSNWIKSVLPFSSRATFLTSSLKSASSCTYGIATSSCYERKNTGIASCTLVRKVCRMHNTLVLKYPSDKHFDFYTSRVLQEDQKSNRTEPNLISWAMKRSRFFAISHDQVTDSSDWQNAFAWFSSVQAHKISPMPSNSFIETFLLPLRGTSRF